MITKKKKATYAIVAVILIVALSLSLLIYCFMKSRKPGTPDTGDDGYPSDLFVSGVYSPSKVGYSAEYLGTTARRSSS